MRSRIDCHQKRPVARDRRHQLITITPKGNAVEKAYGIDSDVNAGSRKFPLLDKMKISYTVSRGSIVDEDGSYKCLRKGNWEEPDKAGGIKINAQRGFSNRIMLSVRNRNQP